MSSGNADGGDHEGERRATIRNDPRYVRSDALTSEDPQSQPRELRQVSFQYLFAFR